LPPEGLLLLAVKKKVLVDFQAHPQWNPFVRSIEGSPREGDTLKVSIQSVGGKGMTFRPRVLRAVPDQELRWLGRVVLPGIFDGEHFFKIEPLDQGCRTRFIHGETIYWSPGATVAQRTSIVAHGRDSRP
jgi:hypothetical protein